MLWPWSLLDFLLAIMTDLPDPRECPETPTAMAQDAGSTGHGGEAGHVTEPAARPQQWEYG